ncbi:hypothetical protein [Chthonobacter rhizosphaerae]|uniref:hypothetical protein n=1 Tax=Chthonobacter rhizosphaerae TaxID=2735553 RepID=UPI0015EEA252|nr:hypothetical protein [Chthonobacter rhizosphaerae]
MSAGLLSFAAAAGAVAILSLAPGANGEVAVLAPASTPAVEIVAAAGGAVAAVSPSGRVAIAVATADGFVGRLYRAGALLVFNPALASGCEPQQGRDQ